MTEPRIRSLSIVYLSLLALIGAAAAFWPSPRVSAVDRDRFAMEVLVDGTPLPEYAARGTTYVEALEGKEYSIRLTNRTGERVAVALSVDGLNSIDARTTTVRDARKWILDPWQTVVLDGWQTSGGTARRFYFTSEPDSYGAWLGKTKNLGVVSAAFFRERRPEPRPEESRVSELRRQRPTAPSAERSDAAKRENEAAAGLGALSDEAAATGIGREIDHRVRQVAFEEESSPSALFEIRYEYRDALVRLGVLPRPRPACDDSLARRERAHGFEEGGFAPDPYRRIPRR